MKPRVAVEGGTAEQWTRCWRCVSGAEHVRVLRSSLVALASDSSPLVGGGVTFVGDAVMLIAGHTFFARDSTLLVYSFWLLVALGSKLGRLCA
jgi:hypothetical protein